MLSIRDASLTTKKAKQRALAAYRNSTQFPTLNTVRPEQPNTQTGDVSVDARQGACLLGCNPQATSDGYGFQAPADIKHYNK